MKKLVRCKACGYIMGEGDVKDLCPACGVPAKAFEPYTSKISEKREKILSLHLHPIIVHFPQALVVLVVFFAATALIFGDILGGILQAGLRINAVFLPLSVIAAFLVGLLDGKTRYKRLTTPALKSKMVLGIAFFVLSLAAALLVLLTTLTSLVLIIVLVLGIAGLVIAIRLGEEGSSLMEAFLPG